MTQPPSMPAPTEPARAAFDAVAEELIARGDIQGASMFGMPSLKRRGGKAFAGLYGDAMVFKLSGPEHAQALALEGAHLFEPMAGRPMRQWVQVPIAHHDRWVDLAQTAESGLEA